MPNGMFNWTFDDVVRFLKDNGFTHNHTEGSHFYYVGNHAGQIWQVSVPFHGSRALKPRTMNSIIKQSGLAKKTWLES
jgi:predicted RNA binding protein YcfA (HicA-like mRNA interferase family)